MSGPGRTSWFARDAAWHRRELIVELGEEFKAEAISVMDVLCAWAQEQRAAGAVKGGFRILAREAFVTVSHAVSIVARAAEIGLLDDLQVADDRRRFTCRVSGWKADAERGRAALRQDARRNPPSNPPTQTVTDTDESRPVTVSHAETPTRPYIGEREETRARSDLDALVVKVVEVLQQCPRLRVERVGVENAIAAWPDRDYLRAAHTVVTWATDPTFRATNAARLMTDALSKQTVEKVAALDDKKARDARRLASLHSLTGGDAA